MTEFDCCECGVHVIAIIPDKPPEPRLCAACIYMPSWYLDQSLAEIMGRRIVPDDTQ